MNLSEVKKIRRRFLGGFLDSNNFSSDVFLYVSIVLLYFGKFLDSDDGCWALSIDLAEVDGFEWNYISFNSRYVDCGDF